MLNELVVSMIPELARMGDRVRLVHQTGPSDHAAVARRYHDAGFQARVVPYLDDMPAELADTDLAICRAGAMTVAELAATGTAAILVPFARATGDHQTKNAVAHAAGGGAWVIPEVELHVRAVMTIVARCVGSPEELGERQRAAHDRAAADAAARIARRVMELAGER